MRKLRYISRRFLGSLSALCLAGASCVPFSVFADSVTVPPANAPASLVAAIEAILSVQETDAWIVQDYSVYAANYTNLINNLDGLLYELAPDIAGSLVRTLLDSIDDLLNMPSVASNAAAVAVLRDMQGSIGGGLAFWAYGAVNTCKSAALAIDDEIQQTRIIESATMTMQGGEVPSGSCNCPDYSSALYQLNTALLDVYDCLADGVDTLYGVASGLSVNSSGGLIYLGVDLGRRLSVLRSAVDAAAIMQSTTQDGLDTDEYIELLGSRVGLVVDAISHAWSINDDLPEPWPMVQVWRDWWLGTRYNFPTNRADNALWVQFADDALFQLKADFKVAVTNDVLLDTDHLLDALTNAVFRVEIPTNNIVATAEATARAEIDIGEDELDDQSDADKETDPLRQTDLSRLQQVGTTLSSIAYSYSGMFDSIPTDPPGNIMIHPGFTLGSITVESMYWYPDGQPGQSGNRSGSSGISHSLGFIRGIFRAFWGIGFVFVVLWFGAVDIAILRAAVVATYFVMLGDGRAALKAVNECVGILGDMLGYRSRK